MIGQKNSSSRQSPEDERKISRVLVRMRRYGRRRLDLHFLGLPRRKQLALASLLPAAPLLPLLQQDTTSSSGAAAQLPRCLRTLRDACRGVPGDKNMTGLTAFSSRSTRSATTLPAATTSRSENLNRRPAGFSWLRIWQRNYNPHTPDLVGVGPNTLLHSGISVH